MEKEKVIEIDFTPEEEKLVRAYAAVHNMSVSDFIIEVVKEKIKKELNEEKDG